MRVHNIGDPMKILSLVILLSASLAAQAFMSPPSPEEEAITNTILLQELAKRTENQKPAFTPIEMLMEKRKAQDYAYFLVHKKSPEMPNPSYEDFKKNPDSYFKEDWMRAHTKAMDNKKQRPDNSFEFCQKTALQDIVCPEGTYTFSGSKLPKEIDDSLREATKEAIPQKQVTPSKKTSARGE